MAIITNSPIGMIHGSIGGITFYGSGTKQKARIRTYPKVTASPNLLLSQSIMSMVSSTWAIIPPSTKTLWDTFATNWFHPHEITSKPPYKGYFAYNSLYKLWQESVYKSCPFVYKFDSGLFINPLNVNFPAFSSVPPTRDFFLDLCKVDNSAVPLLCDNIEINASGFVQFRLNYTHTPPPPLFENVWNTPFGQRIMFGVWMSDSVPFLNSQPTNYFRYYLGCTGYILNPPNTLSNSHTCTILMDCSSVIAKNFVFPPLKSYVWLNLEGICESGAFCGGFVNCKQINNTFSW
jgi:hypothetical protein